MKLFTMFTCHRILEFASESLRNQILNEKRVAVSERALEQGFVPLVILAVESIVIVEYFYGSR